MSFIFALQTYDFGDHLSITFSGACLRYTSSQLMQLADLRYPILRAGCTPESKHNIVFLLVYQLVSHRSLIGYKVILGLTMGKQLPDQPSRTHHGCQPSKRSAIARWIKINRAPFKRVERHLNALSRSF
jgi:hypothetical protein